MKREKKESNFNQKPAEKWRELRVSVHTEQIEMIDIAQRHVKNGKM